MCLEYNKKEEHTSPNSKCLSLIVSKKAVNVFNFAQDEDWAMIFKYHENEGNFASARSW